MPKFDTIKESDQEEDNKTYSVKQTPIATFSTSAPETED